jgi:hypothetical protein
MHSAADPLIHVKLARQNRFVKSVNLNIVAVLPDLCLAADIRHARKTDKYMHGVVARGSIQLSSARKQT